MKKLWLMLAVSTLVIAGCSSGKYADKIDKAVDKQNTYQENLAEKQKGDLEEKFDKKNSNIYVYEEGKYVMLAYKPFKDDEEVRSEEHTSELQSRFDLVCRLLLEKKKRYSNLTRQ